MQVKSPIYNLLEGLCTVNRDLSTFFARKKGDLLEYHCKFLSWLLQSETFFLSPSIPTAILDTDTPEVSDVETEWLFWCRPWPGVPPGFDQRSTPNRWFAGQSTDVDSSACQRSRPLSGNVTERLMIGRPSMILEQQWNLLEFENSSTVLERGNRIWTTHQVPWK